MAVVFALTSKDPTKQPAPAGDALVYIVDSFLRASVTLLEYLDNAQRAPNEATFNPANHERQTQEKPTRSVENKADKWLKLRLENRRQLIKREAKEREIEITDNEIGRYLEEFVFCKYREELSAMIAKLPTTNSENSRGVGSWTL